MKGDDMKFLYFVLLFFLFIFPIFSDEIETLKKENENLKERIEVLEKAFHDLKKQIEIKNPPSVKPDSPLRDILQQENRELLERIKKVEEQTSLLHLKFLKGKLDISLYGYIKVDMIYDTARINNGSVAYWAESEEAIDEEDDQFNLTPNQTRFGLDIKAPLFEGIETTGKIEMDFYGGGNENTSRLRFRHVYFQLHWIESDFSILAGQTADVMGPLCPNTINFMVLCSSGNIGYRRPQVRLTKGWKINKNSKLSVEIAATRTIGIGNALYSEYLDSGEDSGFPSMQGRIGISLPFWMDKPASFGISGHWGQEEYDLDKTGKNKDFDSWSLILDITLPLNEKITLKGEIWIGKNLASYFGGIQQGANIKKLKEISAQGGWVSMEIGPIGKWRFNLGAGIDDPSDEDINPGDRSKNWSIFVNTYYNLTDYCTLGGEISYWNTSYEGLKKGDSVRVYSTMILNF